MTEWIERWHGSGPDRGWSIWEVGHGDRIAYVGEGDHSERLTSLIVQKHNEALSAALPAVPLQGQAQGVDALEEAARICERLRDDHIAGTRSADNPGDWCAQDGDDCDFVCAWNDAAAAIREYAQRLAGQAQAAPADRGKPLNGIPATDFHGEGAIARCSYCGRYSLDRKTLGEDRYQPVCECGEKHGWSGSFKRPGPDAKWSGTSPTVATGQAPAVPRNDAEQAAWLADKIVAMGDYAKEAAAMLRRWPARAATPPASELSDEELIQIAQNIREPGNEVAESWGVCYGYTQDAAGQYTVPRVPAIAIKFARSLLAGGRATQATQSDADGGGR